MLVLPVMRIMPIYQLPQGQYGYSGHVINLPQDVASFSNSLPWLPSELDVISVRKESTDRSHRHFHIRRSVVHRALQWLVMYNKYYRSSSVYWQQYSWPAARGWESCPTEGELPLTLLPWIVLHQLPPHLQAALAPITSTSPDNVILTCNSSLVDEPYDSYCAHLPQLFVPTAMWSMTEQEAVVKSVEERQSSSSPSSLSATLMCPSIGGMPINDFTTEGYFTCKLSPHSSPLVLLISHDQGRQNQVNIFNKHITTMHIWSVFASMYNHTLLYLTLWSKVIISTVYSMAPSGPFNVACTIIIQTIYLATTVYLALHSII